MPKYKKTARISQWIARLFMLILMVSLFLMPRFVSWYAEKRILTDTAQVVLLWAYYLCAVPAFWALLQIDNLLRNIGKDQVFLEKNCRIVTRIALCCAIVSLITLVSGFVYPPLLFIAVLMLFLGLLVYVVSNVLSAATALRDENDLTI